MPNAERFFGTKRFKVVRRLGAGGMGVVYEAMDLERNGRVALKTFRPNSPGAVLHLKDEFRALQNVHHRNLVRLGELIEDSGHWFFTMELVDGVDFLHHVGMIIHAHGSQPWTQEPISATEPHGSAGLLGSPRDAVRLPPIEPPLAIGTLDEARLRAALVQLVDGLDALHAVGKIHRDIKPSNVLVTNGNHRVVILDFGVVLDTARHPDITPSEVVGTVAYMAPEQAAAGVVGPPADWYAVGVLIYQALTGQLPFSGHPLYVLTEKQERAPTPPHQLSSEAPADLSALCMELLRPDPGDRPSGKDILDQLRTRAPAPLARRHQSGPIPIPFVGRSEELARLHTALSELATGRPIAAVVRGDSGVGKSFLARQFVDGIDRSAGQEPEVLVLRGRCYERESVPYKAFDGLIDELTRFLSRLAPASVADLLPEHVAFAAQVFPVLRSVDAIAAAVRPDDVPDPQQQRIRVFAAVRRLFGALARRYRLILVIDDLQWTDADSLGLLRELLRPPGAPAILYVATLRPTSMAPVPLAEIEKTVALAGTVHDLQLGALSDDAAAELVHQLARRMGAPPPADTRAIADDARGHPLFIQELVHHRALPDGAGRGAVHLDDAIALRVARLDDAQRRIIELVTIAGHPLPQDTIARAAHAEFDAFSGDAEALRAANLIRTSGARRGDVVEPYHDRVREAVLARLAPDQRAAAHEQLALALEATQHPDPETLAVHWRGAGKPARAVSYTVLAAEQAAAAVAFGRAARLYRLALELGLPTPGEHRQVTERLADALAHDGQGAAAATAYLDAARGAPAALQRRLEQRAAEQLLRTGHINDGLAHVRTVLASMGLDVPDTPRRALVSLLYQRALVRLRGLRFVERAEAEVAPELLERIDACWTVALLGFVDTLRGADFGARHLRLALAAGEPLRLARALAVEAVYAANITHGYQPRAHRLLAEAERLAASSNSSYAVAFVAGAASVVAHALGQYRLARSHAERGERIFRASCTGVAWELDLVQLIALMCLYYEGDLRELGRRLGPALADAEERGDLFGVSSLQVIIKYRAHLFLDQPDDARRAVVQAMARWTQDGFQLQHRHELLAHAEIDMYLGHGGEAHRRFDRSWRALSRSLLLEAQQQRLELYDARGRAAIAAADEPGADRRALYAAAERYAQRIERDEMAWASPLAALIRGGVAERRGHSARAIALLRDALRGFDTAGMALHAAITRRVLGQRVAAAEGDSLIAAADGWLATAKVRDVVRATRLLAPGFAPK